MKLTANWHLIDYFDKISFPATSLPPRAQSPWNLIPELYEFSVDPDTGYWTLNSYDISARNFDSERQTGIDYSAEYSTYTKWGDFYIRGTLSQLLDYEQNFKEGISVNEDDYIGVRVPEYNAQINVQWSKGNWYAAVDSSYRSETVFESNSVYSAFPSQSFYYETTSFWQTNVQAAYTFSSDGLFDGVQLKAGVNNIWDQHADSFLTIGEDRYNRTTITRQDGSIPYSSNATASNPYGRMFYMSLSKEF